MEYTGVHRSTLEFTDFHRRGVLLELGEKKSGWPETELRLASVSKLHSRKVAEALHSPILILVSPIHKYMTRRYCFAHCSWLTTVMIP